MSELPWLSSAIKELQHPRPAFAVLFACGVCLFLSGPVASWIGAGPGTTAWFDKARPWLVVGFLVSAALLLWDIGRVVGAWWRVDSARRAAIDELKHLPARERRQVELWLREGYRSGRLDSEGTGEALADRGIFERGERSAQFGGMRLYRIPPFIWKYLSTHPDVVKPEE